MYIGACAGTAFLLLTLKESRSNIWQLKPKVRCIIDTGGSWICSRSSSNYFRLVVKPWLERSENTTWTEAIHSENNPYEPKSSSTTTGQLVKTCSTTKFDPE
eukprot:155903-Amphidinium_carterae.1